MKFETVRATLVTYVLGRLTPRMPLVTAQRLGADGLVDDGLAVWAGCSKGAVDAFSLANDSAAAAAGIGPIAPWGHDQHARTAGATGWLASYFRDRLVQHACPIALVNAHRAVYETSCRARGQVTIQRVYAVGEWLTIPCFRN